jgi:hypothetical protein
MRRAISSQDKTRTLSLRANSTRRQHQDKLSLKGLAYSPNVHGTKSYPLVPPSKKQKEQKGIRVFGLGQIGETKDEHECAGTVSLLPAIWKFRAHKMRIEKEMDPRLTQQPEGVPSPKAVQAMFDGSIAALQLTAEAEEIAKMSGADVKRLLEDWRERYGDFVTEARAVDALKISSDIFDAIIQAFTQLRDVANTARENLLDAGALPFQ